MPKCAICGSNIAHGKEVVKGTIRKKYYHADCVLNKSNAGRKESIERKLDRKQKKDKINRVTYKFVNNEKTQAI